MTDISLTPWRMQPDVTGCILDLWHTDTLIARLPMNGARVYGQSDGGTIENVRWSESGAYLCCERQVRVAVPISAVIYVRDLLRWRSEGMLEWHRSWWHTEEGVVSSLELFASVEAMAPMRAHLLPAILYDGNAGAVAERVVPRLAYGMGNLFEEHKFPTPLVQVETVDAGNRRWGISLRPEPCAVVDGHRADQWWSLGLQIADEDAAPVILSVSGHLAMNGQDESIYDAQNQLSVYQDAWVDARPHHVYEKQYHLELQADVAERQAWRSPLRQALASQPPLTQEENIWLSRERLLEAIELKVAYGMRRWREDSQCCGMDKWPSRDEFAHHGEEGAWMLPSTEFGWTGQNGLFAMSLWRWGKRTGQVELIEKSIRIVDKWLQVAMPAIRGGSPAPTCYVWATQQWQATYDGAAGFARPTVETLNELVMFCRLLRVNGEARNEWETQLIELLRWYLAPAHRRMDGFLPLKWDERGNPMPEDQPVTAGVLLVSALAEASALPVGASLLTEAEKLMAVYAARFLGAMPSHPCGSALDSGCEDEESGLFLLLASLSLHDAQVRQGSPTAQTLEYATLAADWLLTFTYSWNVPLLPGTLLHALSFSTRGLSDVSVQNRHVHVYTAAAQLARLATLLAESSAPLASLYGEQARRMLLPVVRTIARPECRWGMDEDGEQTEQYNQTNYIQHAGDPVCVPRGGIARWFMPWITVWVLATCLDFLDLEEG